MIRNQNSLKLRNEGVGGKESKESNLGNQRV